MSRFLRAVSLVFAAGCVGGVFNGLAGWLCGRYGISAALGVSIAPALSPGFLYQRAVWGGLWGFLFLLPMLRSSVLARGILFSLAPALVQLLVVFPYQAHKGVFGFALGTLTPVLVFVFNAVWGVAAALWVRLAK